MDERRDDLFELARLVARDGRLCVAVPIEAVALPGDLLAGTRGGEIAALAGVDETAVRVRRVGGVRSPRSRGWRGHRSRPPPRLRHGRRCSRWYWRSSRRRTRPLRADHPASSSGVVAKARCGPRIEIGFVTSWSLVRAKRHALTQPRPTAFSGFRIHDFASPRPPKNSCGEPSGAVASNVVPSGSAHETMKVRSSMPLGRGHQSAERGGVRCERVLVELLAERERVGGRRGGVELVGEEPVGGEPVRGEPRRRRGRAEEQSDSGQTDEVRSSAWQVLLGWRRTRIGSRCAVGVRRRQCVVVTRGPSRKAYTRPYARQDWRGSRPPLRRGTTSTRRSVSRHSVVVLWRYSRQPDHQ